MTAATQRHFVWTAKIDDNTIHSVGTGTPPPATGAIAYIDTAFFPNAAAAWAFARSVAAQHDAPVVWSCPDCGKPLTTTANGATVCVPCDSEYMDGEWIGGGLLSDDEPATTATTLPTAELDALIDRIAVAVHGPFDVYETGAAWLDPIYEFVESRLADGASPDFDAMSDAYRAWIMTPDTDDETRIQKIRAEIRRVQFTMTHMPVESAEYMAAWNRIGELSASIWRIKQTAAASAVADQTDADALYRAAQRAKYGDAAAMRDRYTLAEVRDMRRQTCVVYGHDEIEWMRAAIANDERGLSSRSERLRSQSVAFLAWHVAELAELMRESGVAE